jgi:hypothetical protein
MRYKSITRKISEELNVPEVLVKKIITHRWNYIKDKMMGTTKFSTVLEGLIRIKPYNDYYYDKWEIKTQLKRDRKLQKLKDENT